MEKINLNEALWTERYRPQTIEDCILPAHIKSTFKDIAKSGNVPNMILSGTSGLGKTSLIKALCNELNLDYLFINASSENGVDVLRNKITQFASSVSFNSGVKVVILDEADGLSQNFMMAFKASLEEFTACRFIFTANFKNKIISAIHSRCTIVDFNTDKKTLASLAQQFMKRVQFILKNENIKYDDKTIAELIIRFAPDWRRCLGELQRYSVSGEITPDILVGMSDENISELIGFIKTKDFGKARSWVSSNTSLDSTVIYHKIYDSLNDHVLASSIPQAVLILAEYSFKSGQCVDKELQLISACVELMGNISWK